jgi:hypothetical protein
MNKHYSERSEYTSTQNVDLLSLTRVYPVTIDFHRETTSYPSFRSIFKDVTRMNAHRIFAAVVLLFVGTGQAPAEGIDLADLAPARTLAYLELHDPTAFARELHALFKGSYLQQPGLLFARHTTGRNKINAEAFLFAWFGSSEFLDELGDWKSSFIALTGFTKGGEPELVGVMRTGKSRMLPLAVRFALIEDGDFHCIARVEGVPIFQIGKAEKTKRPEIAKGLRLPTAQLARLFHTPRKASLYQVAWLDNMPVEELDDKPEFGCFVSLLPGALAFGTTPDVLADAIRRLKGKSVSPSLATTPAFRAAAPLRQPGLFAWSDPPRLTGRINDLLRRDLEATQDEIRRRPAAKGEKRDAVKLRAELRQAEIDHRRETQEWTFFQKAANPNGMTFAAAAWSLHKGEWVCRFDVRMREKQTSPLLDVSANRTLSTELLQAVPGDTFALFAVPLPDDAAMLARAIKLADAYVAESGEDAPLPSKALAEWEKRLKLHLSRDVLGKIRSMAVAVHWVEENGANVYPILVVEAKNESAAKDLVAVLPRLYGSIGVKQEPQLHTLDSQRIFSLTEEAVNANLEEPPAHYGQRGKIVVLGWHRGRVVATLHHMNDKKDLLNLPRASATVEAEGPVVALGLFSCRQFLAHLTRIGSETGDQDAGSRRLLAYLREMSAPMATMPPTVFGIKRLPDGLRVEFRQSELPAATATVVDMLLTWMLDEETAKDGWFNFGFVRPQAPAVPAAGPMGGNPFPPGVPAPVPDLPVCPD